MLEVALKYEKKKKKILVISHLVKYQDSAMLTCSVITYR